MSLLLPGARLLALAPPAAVLLWFCHRTAIVTAQQHPHTKFAAL